LGEEGSNLMKEDFLSLDLSHRSKLPLSALWYLFYWLPYLAVKRILNS